MNDDPSQTIRPEYVATTCIAKNIGNKFIKSSDISGLKLQLEERADLVATRCFERFKPAIYKRTVPPRNLRAGHQKIDITIFNKKGILETTKSVIEVKVNDNSYGLGLDLKRNKFLIEQSDTKAKNTLEATFLAFSVTDKKSFSGEDATKKRKQLLKRFKKLANKYASPIFRIHVSVRCISNPPEEDDRIGQFYHMASVVIAFKRI